MKRLSGIFSMLVTVFLANVYCSGGLAQSLHLSGLVSHINIKKPIDGVSIYALIDNQRKKIGMSDVQGKFLLEYPQTATALVIEKAGYRTLSIATAAALGSTELFFIELPLIPLDQQTSDKPYMQSEQKDFTLDTENAGKKSVTRIFKIKDALSSQIIVSASICFEYTKVEKKECKEIVPAAPSQSMSFSEADIINMVVESPGYQTYRGNLILEKMDGSSSIYEVKMTPEVTIFTTNLKNVTTGVSCILTSAGGEKITMKQEGAASFYALGKAGNYVLNVSNAKGGLLHSEKINIRKGLNYQVVTIANKPPAAKQIIQPAVVPAAAVVSNVTPLADTVKNVTLYFNQSAHELLAEAKQELDRLAMWLKGEAGRQIRIVGHSDNVGDPKRNETLSEYRARMTFNYLLEKGVAQPQMHWAAIGGRRPVKENDSEENKRKNRRVEITLYPEK